MDKILIIGVGGAGSHVVEKLKKMNIPHVEYETFGTYEDVPNDTDIFHHNLITMGGETSVSAGSGPEVFRDLAEHAKDDLRDIISSHFEEE